MRTRAIMLLATGVLAISVLAGCGDDGDGEALDPGASDTSGATSDAPSPSPTESDQTSEAPVTESATVTPDPLPACSDIWVGGQKLPAKYKGCEGDAGPVKAKKYPCSFGSSIVTFDDRFYAQLGRPINEVDSLKSSNAFQSALRACQA